MTHQYYDFTCPSVVRPRPNLFEPSGPVFRVDSDEPCPICREAVNRIMTVFGIGTPCSICFEVKERCVVIVPCGHWFCQKCATTLWGDQLQIEPPLLAPAPPPVPPPAPPPVAVAAPPPVALPDMLPIDWPFGVFGAPGVPVDQARGWFPFPPEGSIVNFNRKSPGLDARYSRAVETAWIMQHRNYGSLDSLDTVLTLTCHLEIGNEREIYTFYLGQHTLGGRRYLRQLKKKTGEFTYGGDKYLLDLSSIR
jgi:hypothetical protein